MRGFRQKDRTCPADDIFLKLGRIAAHFFSLFLGDMYTKVLCCPWKIAVVRWRLNSSNPHFTNIDSARKNTWKHQSSAPTLILTFDRGSSRSDLSGYVMCEQIWQKSVLKERSKAPWTSDNVMIADNIACFCPLLGQFFLGQFPDTTPDSVTDCNYWNQKEMWLQRGGILLC